MQSTQAKYTPETSSIATPSYATRPAEVKGKSPNPQRISALDFTKGALVLIMVLYHWINYFIGADWPYYFYLRFLTPSFIFISGFMISHVYLSKYDAADLRLSKRLFTRGVKLLVIFSVLNVARDFIVPMLSTGTVLEDQLAPKNLVAVFLSGDFSAAGGKVVSFSILVPIAYLLMLSALLMFPLRIYRYTFHAFCGLLLLFILTIDLLGYRSLILEMVSIGMLGILIGFFPLGMIDKYVAHPYVLGLIYAGYLIAITFVNVPYPLLIVGVCLSVAAIYLVGSSSESSWIRNEVNLLGKYSLFGYISQIAFLQILYAAFRHTSMGFVVFGVSFVAAFALTVFSVELVDRARKKAASMDRLYKAVFA